MKKLLIAAIVIIVALFLIKRKEMTWRQSILKAVYPLNMLRTTLFGSKHAAQTNTQTMLPPVSFYSLSAIANNGAVVNFNQFRGKKVLLVNTASNCGYTGQYADLQRLHEQYPDRLVVIGFPANDFKQQEPQDDAAIAKFCKMNYGIGFMLIKKSTVIKGADQHPVFRWLSNKQLNGWCNQEPTWNFCKYIVNEEGVLEAFFPQTVSPGDKEVLKFISTRP